MDFVFKLSEQEGQMVLNSLRKEPYGLVVDLIEKIQAQAVEQRMKQESQQREATNINSTKSTIL